MKICLGAFGSQFPLLFPDPDRHPGWHVGSEPERSARNETADLTSASFLALSGLRMLGRAVGEAAATES